MENARELVRWGTSSKLKVKSDMECFEDDANNNVVYTNSIICNVFIVLYVNDMLVLPGIALV